MKYTLHCGPVDGGPFNCMPAREFELEDSDIICNDIIFPEEFNPNKVQLFVVGNEFGALFAIWSAEHELLDNAVDANRMDSFGAEDDHKECEAKHTDECGHALLGNASEPFNLDYCWYQRVVFEPTRDWKLMCKFAEARGLATDTLYF